MLSFIYSLPDILLSPPPYSPVVFFSLQLLASPFTQVPALAYIYVGEMDIGFHQHIWNKHEQPAQLLCQQKFCLYAASFTFNIQMMFVN